MRKTFKKQQDESQIIWKNTTNEPAFNPHKLTKYYATIQVGNASFLTEYEAKTRSEARTIFEEEARLSGGKLEVISTYK